MSSLYVRDAIKTYILTNAPTEHLIDFTAEDRDIDTLITDESLTYSDPFLGIQFIPSVETPISLPTKNNTGCYRELGTFFLHVVEPSAINHTANILTRSDVLMGLFRGAKVGTIIIEDLVPPNFESAATLNFDDGYQAAGITISFQSDRNF